MRCGQALTVTRSTLTFAALLSSTQRCSIQMGNGRLKSRAVRAPFRVTRYCLSAGRYLTCLSPAALQLCPGVWNVQAGLHGHINKRRCHHKRMLWHSACWLSCGPAWQVLGAQGIQEEPGPAALGGEFHSIVCGAPSPGANSGNEMIASYHKLLWRQQLQRILVLINKQKVTGFCQTRCAWRQFREQA